MLNNHKLNSIDWSELNKNRDPSRLVFRDAWGLCGKAAGDDILVQHTYIHSCHLKFFPTKMNLVFALQQDRENMALYYKSNSIV